MTIDLDWGGIDACIRDLRAQIQQDIPHWDKITCIGITNGGVIPAMMLSKRLHCEFAILDIRNKNPVSIGAEILNYTRPIIVEDIVDSGNTLWTLYRAMENHPTKDFKIATLIQKKKASMRADYNSIITAEDSWYTFPWEYDEIEKRGRDKKKQKS